MRTITSSALSGGTPRAAPLLEPGALGAPQNVAFETLISQQRHLKVR
jgi:hypothetical protein